MRRCRRPLALLALLTLSGCDLRFGFPDPASAHGQDVLRLWRGTFIAAAVVGTTVWGLIVFVLLRYRRRDDTLPSQNPYNIPLEIVYTIVPILIVAGLFFFTVRTEDRVTSLSPHPDLTVSVVGFQWQWQFSYAEQGIVITGDNTIGPPQLVVPVGATVRLELESDDVDHAFWVPDFLDKRDLIPGLHNVIDVQVIRAGTYVGRCAEYCGLDHARMTFSVRAVPRSGFDDWVTARQREQGATP